MRPRVFVMSKLQCPSHQKLVDLLLGRLPDEEAEAVAAHLDECSGCSDTVASLDESTSRLVRSDVPPPAPSSAEPPHIREYRLLGVLGRGGMGTVYRAVHTQLDRPVALKVLPARYAHDHAAVARFQSEIKAVGRLDHPNIVRATDAGEQNGLLFLVMEFLDGADCRRLLDHCGPLPLAIACEIARQAAYGLEHAHASGLVHRDVKPSNLFVTREGVVKILDLGLARFTGAPVGEITRSGLPIGTPQYMAPEQVADPAAANPRCDIYSLGVTLHAMLLGHPPTAEVSSHSLASSDLPLPLQDVLLRSLASHPEGRFASAADLATALSPFAEDAHPERLLQGIPTFADEPVSDPQLLAGSRDTTSDHPTSLRRAVPVTIALTVFAVLAVLIATKGAAILAAFTGGDSAPNHSAELDPPADPASPFVDCTWVRFVNVNSGHVLAVNDASAATGESLRQSALKADAFEQQWRIESTGQPRWYRLKNRKSGLYVAIKAPRQSEAFAQWPLESDQDSFLFAIHDAGDGHVRLINKASRFCMGVWGADTRDSQWVIQWPYSETSPDHRWTIERIADWVEERPASLAELEAISPREPSRRQRQTAEQLGVPVEITNSAGMKFVLVPRGVLLAGTDRTDRKHEPIAFSFYLSTCEVTQAQYHAAIGTRPGRAAPEDAATPPHPGDDSRRLPIVNVTWHEAAEFCNRLSLAERLPPYYRIEGDKVRWLGGQGYRLPEENEWLYAAFDGDMAMASTLAAQAASIAWFGTNSDGRTHPVGLKSPNGLGLYDVLGNVWEYVGAASSFRGGYYGGTTNNFAEGFNNGANWRSSDVGFRIARNLPSTVSPADPLPPSGSPGLDR